MYETIKANQRWVIKIKLSKISMKIKSANKENDRKKIKVLKETKFFGLLSDSEQ